MKIFSTIVMLMILAFGMGCDRIKTTNQLYTAEQVQAYTQLVDRAIDALDQENSALDDIVKMQDNLLKILELWAQSPNNSSLKLEFQNARLRLNNARFSYFVETTFTSERAKHDLMVYRAHVMGEVKK